MIKEPWAIGYLEGEFILTLNTDRQVQLRMSPKAFRKFTETAAGLLEQHAKETQDAPTGETEVSRSSHYS